MNNNTHLDFSSEEETFHGVVGRLSHGSISVIGRRRAMEDAIAVEKDYFNGEFQFFGVYDGHGGVRVANECKLRLHKFLAEEINEWRDADGIDWEKAMMGCFEKMDWEVINCSPEIRAQEKSWQTVGSTAVVVMVGKKDLVVANCGDSRAVLYSGGVAIPLSRDHKPDRPDETERVEAAGGRIINWNGSRVAGVLATSRSIGDEYMKPYIIAEPEVTLSKRSRLDYFIIIATDGLWDVLSNEVACHVVKKCLSGKISKRFAKGRTAVEAATLLGELAMARGSKDNISVIVVELNKVQGQ